MCISQNVKLILRGLGCNRKVSPCNLRTCMCVFVCTCWNMRAAPLPSVWRIRPLLLLRCPPAALCCQVEPEGLALIMGKRLTVTLTQDVAMASWGQGWTGHALLPVAAFWDNESHCRPSAASALPTAAGTGTNNSLWVYACVCARLHVCERGKKGKRECYFFHPSLQLLYCHFAVPPAGLPCWHIYLSGKWGTAATGHVKTFTNSIKNVRVCEKS